MKRMIRILVVDNESDPILVAADHGFDVKTAWSGLEALEALKSPIDAVAVRKESAGQACDEIVRTARKKYDAAVFLIATDTRGIEETEFLLSGADAIVGKPIDLREISDILEKRPKRDTTVIVPGKPRILVVDDDMTFLRFMEGMLAGHDISIADNPVEALEMIRETAFDILLTDMMMYGMDGMDVVRAALNIRPGIVPILMTGFASKDILADAFKQGVYDFLEKPLTPGIVLQRIDRAWKSLRADLTNRKLLAELRDANRELTKARDGMERRVEERTAELVEVNKRLKRELDMRRMMERRISEALDLNRKIIAASSLGITAYKSTGECILANRAAARIMGLSKTDVLRQNFRFLKYWEKTGLLKAADEAMSGSETQIEIRFENAFGKPLWLACRFVSFAMNGEKHLLLVADDISVRKKAEEKIRHIALHDNLTGLPNRNLFYDRLSHALLRGNRYKLVVGLLYIDLDGFKPVNDTYGHDAGDTFLREVACRIKNGVRESDTAARLGGDEFAVILQELNERQEAEIVAKRLLQSFSRPIRITEDKEITGSVSIGIATYPYNGRKADILLQNADMAMYKVKKTGKNNFHFAD